MAGPLKAMPHPSPTLNLFGPQFPCSLFYKFGCIDSIRHATSFVLHESTYYSPFSSLAPFCASNPNYTNTSLPLSLSVMHGPAHPSHLVTKLK